MPSTPAVVRTEPRRYDRSLPWRFVDAGLSRRHDPHFQLEVTLATLFALATGAFLHVVEDYLDNDPIVRWDVEFSRWLHVHHNATLFSFFKTVTWAGNVAFLAGLVAAVVPWLARKGRLNEAFLVAASAAGIELLNGGLKLLFHRPRPELAYVHLDTYSFPSGHAAGTTAIYGVILYILASRLTLVRSRVLIALGFVLLVATVCFSRLYLEVHYLSDVLAGASLGAAWAAGSLFAFEIARGGDIRRWLPSQLVRAAERFAHLTCIAVYRCGWRASKRPFGFHRSGGDSGTLTHRDRWVWRCLRRLRHATPSRHPVGPMIDLKA